MKIGIIGLGRISHKMAEAISLTVGAELWAVGSRDLSKAREFAESHGAARAYGSYEELCADPELEAVYISTPHGRHYEDAMLALANGKHVLCEKALTVNARLAKKLADEASARGLLLAEAMWTRYIPVNRRVVEWISAGKIGEVRSVSTEIGFTAAPDFSSRLLDLNLGGGALLDIGIYALEYILMIYRGERPKKVAAVGKLFSNGADSNVSASLEFATGTAHFTCTLDANLPCTATIYGSEGSIEVCGAYMAPSKAILRGKSGEETVEIAPGDNGFVHELAAFMHAVKQGKTECAELTPAESVLAAEIIDEIKGQIGLRYPQD
jgi:Predicted dehydrogenases and related proteins